MKGITYEATIENGQVKLPEHVTLPEHATVFVVLPDLHRDSPIRMPTPRLANPADAARFRLEWIEEPPGDGLR